MSSTLRSIPVWHSEVRAVEMPFEYDEKTTTLSGLGSWIQSNYGSYPDKITVHFLLSKKVIDLTKDGESLYKFIKGAKSIEVDI